MIWSFSDQLCKHLSSKSKNIGIVSSSYENGFTEDGWNQTRSSLNILNPSLKHIEHCAILFGNPATQYQLCWTLDHSPPTSDGWLRIMHCLTAIYIMFFRFAFVGNDDMSINWRKIWNSSKLKLNLNIFLPLFVYYFWVLREHMDLWFILYVRLAYNSLYKQSYCHCLAVKFHHRIWKLK